MRRFRFECKLFTRPLVVMVSCIIAMMPAIATQASGEARVPQFPAFSIDQFERSTIIDNQWSPLRPGMHWIYEGHTTEDGEKVPHRIEFTVTDLGKEIAGVRTVVAWVVDVSEGQIVESELSFYAQDNEGNVWYFGEYPESYENGKFVEAPTWIPGVEFAKPGIKMMREPRLDMPLYFQGWGPAVEWTDFGWLVEQGRELCVPAGCYADVLGFDESSLGEPGAFQRKTYARGVGNVLVEWSGADKHKEVLELVEFKMLDARAMAGIRSVALAQEKRAYERRPKVYGKTAPAFRLPLDSASK